MLFSYAPTVVSPEVAESGPGVRDPMELLYTNLTLFERVTVCTHWHQGLFFVCGPEQRGDRFGQVEPEPESGKKKIINLIVLFSSMALHQGLLSFPACNGALKSGITRSLNHTVLQAHGPQLTVYEGYKWRFVCCSDISCINSLVRFKQM